MTSENVVPQSQTLLRPSSGAQRHRVLAVALSVAVIVLAVLVGASLAGREAPRARVGVEQTEAQIPPDSPRFAAPAPSLPPPLDAEALEAGPDGGILEDAKTASVPVDGADDLGTAEPLAAAAPAETESIVEQAPVEEQPSEAAEPAPVTCGVITCGQGQVCCNPSCGICTDPGGSCSKVVCGMVPVAASVTCGPNTCNVGQICCNPTCGICISPGQTCDPTPCDNAPEIPFSVTCGLATCNVGYVCCNASCGICTRPGESCDDRVC